MRQTVLFVAALTLLPGGSSARGAETPEAPWRLHDAAGLPDWLAFSVQHRTRYETLSNTFNKNRDGGDQALAFRTQVFAEASYQQFRVAAEFIDSRSELDDAGTPVNTTLVNEAELLQAYLAWRTANFFGSGLTAEVKFGRQTMDVGSRRLVARNRFRNTINSFNGIDVTVANGRWQWRNFAVMPVSRLPNNANDIRRGTVEFDEENFNVLFAGSFLSVDQLPLDSAGELYFFQLSEQDTANTASKNRNLSTPGFRWYRNPAANSLDFELEAALQTGTSHASTAASDTTKLDHFAYFGHVAFGYTFDLPWSPRLLLQYDYASGDEDPNDGHNGRFETLYGARRFEFGPTGIWGAFARANINSPGVRLEFKPASNLDGFIAHRAHWLAEKRDSWASTGLRDTSGQSGSYIGQLLETRLRWAAIPKVVMLETGWAHLFKGDFAKNAPGAPTDTSDADYFYTQTTLSF